ncbi:MAG TPA: hypothetical protein VJ023_10625 [Pyrinomonadaceae bacterium]|nr:hypothetical protein [Pyrinomonadaceae bacterium]
MKRFTSNLLLTMFTFCVGVVVSEGCSFFRCGGPETEGWKTYADEEYGYRLRYPEGWQLRGSGGALNLCSRRLKRPCGPTPHEVYATVGVGIRDPEGLPLSEYLRAPARGAYKDLRELRVGGVQAFATGPVRDDYGRYIDEQVHVLHRGKVYNITTYAVDARPKEFEKILTTFEFTK